VSNISVKDSDVFTEIMQQQLKDTEVINLGVNGYGQVQEYLLLQEWIDKIRPDLIVFVIYIRNDFNDNIGDHWIYSRPYATIDNNESSLRIVFDSEKKYKNTYSFWEIYRKSHLYFLVDRSFDILRKKLFLRHQTNSHNSQFIPEELYLCRIQNSENTKKMFKIMEKMLLKISGYLNEQDIPSVFVLAPSMLQVNDELWTIMLKEFNEEPSDFKKSLPNDNLMNFAAENNILMFDLLPILQSESNKGKVLYYRYEQHWTIEGNHLVAEQLIDFLKSKSLIQ
jgi:hypothetical protein